jgi:FAD/FMN-containing dehydrogenase
MRTVTIDAEAGTAVIGAGTTIREAVNEAHKNKTHLGIVIEQDILK